MYISKTKNGFHLYNLSDDGHRFQHLCPNHLYIYSTMSTLNIEKCIKKKNPCVPGGFTAESNY